MIKQYFINIKLIIISCGITQQQMHLKFYNLILNLSLNIIYLVSK